MDLSNCLIEMGTFNTTVKGDLVLSDKGLGSLQDINKIFVEIDGMLCLRYNPIKSHVLGLIKIKKLQGVVMDNKVAEGIINKHLPEGDIFSCQEELIDAGLEDYAQL